MYRDITATKTTSQVSKLKYPNIGANYDFEYTYDANGYVATYTDPDNNTTTYTYDAQGQLVSAAGNRTYTYTYDGAGNMLTSNLNGTSHTYTYGNADWKDLLTAFDNQTITYDQIGNPLSYYNGTRWNFTWGNGRNLKTAANGTDSISYTYEADGQRVTKTVNGVVHTYYYADGLLRRETYGDTTLDFFYDGNGVPFSMLQNRSTMYYYVTNMEGDVIRLVDWMGNIAAMYQYDPFGGEVYALGSHAQINPLRYRGYYYDAETELYCLSSRYYDPKIGRFINSDSVPMLGANGDMASLNLFAYCGNNPICRRDTNGRAWETVLDIISLGTSVADVIANPANPWAWAGLAGDMLDVVVPFVGGIGESVDVVKVVVGAVEGTDNVVDAAKAAKQIVSKATGSYEIIYESGKNYVGKGPFSRAITSAVEHAKPNELNDMQGDIVKSITWKSAPNSKQAFIDEYWWQKASGGVLSADPELETYNRIWSPGRSYINEI